VSTDAFATWAGPYVLGALEPADRDAYEAHLAGCAVCQGAVGELAGMPGLLSRVSPDAVLALDGRPAVPPAPPDTLLPGLLHAVRRRRRRSRWSAAGTGALVAAAVAAAVVIPLASRLGVSARPAPAAFPAASPAAPARSMTLLVGAPLSATASVTGVSWGTRVDVWCHYSGRTAAASSPYPGGATPGTVAYVLVAVDRSGHDHELGTWAVVPGPAAAVTGGTALRPADIASVEVRTTTGRTLLRLDESAAPTAGRPRPADARRPAVGRRPPGRASAAAHSSTRSAPHGRRRAEQDRTSTRLHAAGTGTRPVVARVHCSVPAAAALGRRVRG